MPINQYLPRIADDMLTRKLRTAGAVHIVGPKWCGKTATAYRREDGVLVVPLSMLAP